LFARNFAKPINPLMRQDLCCPEACFPIGKTSVKVPCRTPEDGERVALWEEVAVELGLEGEGLVGFL
jgi:hypothetical protein